MARHRGRGSGDLTMTHADSTEAHSSVRGGATETLGSVWPQAGGRTPPHSPRMPGHALTGGTCPAELPLAALPGQRAGAAPQGATVQHCVGPAQALLPRGLLRALHQGRREGALLPDRVQRPAALQPADAAAAGGAPGPHGTPGPPCWNRADGQPPGAPSRAPSRDGRDRDPAPPTRCRRLGEHGEPPPGAQP